MSHVFRDDCPILIHVHTMIRACILTEQHEVRQVEFMRAVEKMRHCLPGRGGSSLRSRVSGFWIRSGFDFVLPSLPIPLSCSILQLPTFQKCTSQSVCITQSSGCPCAIRSLQRCQLKSKKPQGGIYERGDFPWLVSRVIAVSP